MKLYVGGVSASGKTTILNTVSELYSMNIMHGTLDFMQFLGIKDDYQQLRMLPDGFREQKLLEFMESLSLKEIDFLLDSHYLIMVDGVVKPVMHPWIKNYDGLVYIETSVKNVMNRIATDNKNRSLFTPSLTKEEQVHQLRKFMLQSKVVFTEMVRQYNMPSIVIENTNKNIEDVVQEVLLFWKQVEVKVSSN